LLSFAVKPKPSQKHTDDNYTLQSSTRDGTRKILHGREISHSMALQGRTLGLEAAKPRAKEKCLVSDKNFADTAAVR